MKTQIPRRRFLKTAGLSYAGLAVSGINAPAQFFPAQQFEAGISSAQIKERFAQSVSDDKQIMSQWCWAASISMAFGFHGHDVHQNTIVERIKGITINQAAHGFEITQALSATWTDEKGKRFKSTCWVFDRESGDVSRGNRDVIKELNEKRPLVYGSNGHAVLLTYVKYSFDVFGFPQPFYAIARDPWPGKGKRPLTREEMVPIYVAGVQVHEA